MDVYTVVGPHQSMILETDDIQAAARKVGVAPGTLKSYLRQAGAHTFKNGVHVYAEAKHLKHGD